MANTVEWVDDALFLCIRQSGYFSQYACFEERTIAAWNVYVLYSVCKYEWIDIKKSVLCKHETPNKPFWFNFITFNICFPCKCYYIILYYVGRENMFHRINLSLTEEQRQTWCFWENWQGQAFFFFFCFFFWFYKNLALIIHFHLFSLEGGIFLNPSGFVFLPFPGLFNCRRESVKVLTRLIRLTWSLR